MYCTRCVVYLEEKTAHRLQTFPAAYFDSFLQFYVKKSFFISAPIRVIIRNPVTYVSVLVVW